MEEKILYSQSIKTGHQLKFSNGAILNRFEKGTLQFQGKEIARLQLEQDLAKHIEEKSQTSSPQTSSNVLKSSSPEIFIVHGHDDIALEQLQSILRKLNLESYILKNEHKNSSTIIEALEKEICTPTRSTKFGIVLLTPDDIGYAKSEGKTAAKPRARQNVILEMGMLMSALTRKNVAILKKQLKKQEIELPSDIGGILYIPFKDHVKETVPDLYRRLRASGFTINAEQLADALK
ncbi:TIR domain-containing protein [Bartonella heixiaziensis]|uniref:TIR domain-containing protein n=1 Tax=Bartonella heixiaziensis TaxID=1461000 RepID=UPI003D1D50E9